jgi:carbon-monoxide dehydrogenase large subunit
MAATTSPRRRWRSTRTTRSPGLRVKTYANLGAYMSLFSSSVPTYLYATLLSGQYNIPNIFAEVISVYTNTVPVDAYRGAGRPEASFVVERLMETAARQLKVDPAELRRKNFITQFPHQTPVIMAYDIGDFGASLDSAMKAIDYAGFPARKAKAKSEGKLRGIGVSCYIEACGIAPSKGGRQSRRRRGPVGIGGSARQSGRHHRGADRIAQPRPGS